MPLYLNSDYLDNLLGPADQNTEEAPVHAERGLLGDIGVSLGRGAVGLVETGAKAAEAFGYENTADEWAKKTRETSRLLAPDVSEYEGKDGLIKGFVTGAAEALPASLAPAAAGGYAGAMIGSAVGPGGTFIGGTIGAILGTLGFFGAGEGRKTYEEGIAQGMSEKDATIYGWKKGAIEGGLESLAIFLDILIAGSGRVMKAARVGTKAARAGTKAAGVGTKAADGALDVSVRQLISGGPKAFATDMAQVIATEEVTEIIQLFASAGVDISAGMGDGVTKEELVDTMGVTMVMSLLFGGGAATFAATERAKLKNDLKGKPKKNERLSDAILRQKKAVDVIGTELAKQGETELSKNWITYANEALNSGTPINIDESITKAGKEALFKAELRKTGTGTEAANDYKELAPVDRMIAEIETEGYSPELPAKIAGTPAEQSEGLVSRVLASILGPEFGGTPNVSSGIDPTIESIANAPASSEVKPGPNLRAEVAAQGSTPGAGLGRAQDIPRGPMPGAGLTPAASRGVDPNKPDAQFRSAASPTGPGMVSPQLTRTETLEQAAPRTPTAPPQVPQGTPTQTSTVEANRPLPVDIPQGAELLAIAESDPNVELFGTGYTGRDIGNAIMTLRENSGGVSGTEMLSSPEELSEAQEIMRIFGIDPRAVDIETAGNATESQRSLAEAAGDPASSALILGEYENTTLKAWVEGYLGGLNRTFPTLESRKEAIRSFLNDMADVAESTAIGDAIRDNIDGFLENYTSTGNRTRNVGDAVTWNYEGSEVYTGKDQAGNNYWITKNRGKGNWILTKGNEEIGTFASPIEAQQALSGTGKLGQQARAKLSPETRKKLETSKPETGKYTSRKLNDNPNSAYHEVLDEKGKKVGQSFKQKWRAKAARDILNAKPGIPVNTLFKRIAELKGAADGKQFVQDVLSGKLEIKPKTANKPKSALKGTEAPKSLDEITVKVEVIEEETGDIVEIEMTAREAIENADESIEEMYLLRECLGS